MFTAGRGMASLLRSLLPPKLQPGTLLDYEHGERAHILDFRGFVYETLPEYLQLSYLHLDAIHYFTPG